jgi:hypothetical protein
MSEETEEAYGKRLLKLLMADEKLREFSVEDYISAIREYVEEDLRRYVMPDKPRSEPPHPLVVQCLEACINHLSDASMAYYASLK